MSKNLMGKTRDASEPYAVFEGNGLYGYTKIILLKVYQKPALEFSNKYARWFISVKSDHTYGDYDEGDSLVADAVRDLTLVQASDLFIQQYGDCLDELQNKAGFLITDKSIMTRI